MGFNLAQRLAILMLLGLASGSARGQTAPSIEELCSLPAASTGQVTSSTARGERDALLWRAAQAFEQDRFTDSLQALRAAYAAEPSADILFNMGQACLAANRLEDAFALDTRALAESTGEETTARIRTRLDQLRPRLAKVLTMRAILLGSQEKYAEACEVWSRASVLDPRPLYLLQLADAMRQAGRHEEALVIYERLCTMPNIPDIVAVAQRRIAELRAPPAVTAQPAEASAPQPLPAGPVADAAPPAKRAPVYRKWWFWTALSGATVAVGLAVGLGTRAALERPSYSDLRPIVF